MASKKKTRRKVLTASCILAALIVGSSSFAWFTSKDEVVNKLSAANGYDVTIVEDFTPPPSWTPGQTVEKDVKVTNTGNIDAFVKLSLSNHIVLTQYDDAGDSNYNKDSIDKYIQLSKDKVKALQAGGRLVYKEDGNFDNDNILTTEDDKVKGTGFTPTESGFYVFERSSIQDSDGTTKSVEYVGYYYHKADTMVSGDTDAYYAITTTDDDTTLTGFTIDKTKTTTVEPTLTYCSAIPADADAGTPSTPAYIKAEYGADDKAIIININLNETELEKWTENDDGKGINPEFFYKYVLEAGATTGDLITSLELDETVKSDAFVEMDYNLTITVDSAQVVDNDNRQTNATDAVKAVNSANWGATAKFSPADTSTKTDDTVEWTIS